MLSMFQIQIEHGLPNMKTEQIFHNNQNKITHLNITTFQISFFNRNLYLQFSVMEQATGIHLHCSAHDNNVTGSSL
jgi:hypothetical protein